MKARYLLLAGVIAFLISAVIHAPAAILYAWLVPAEPAPMVTASGLTGNLLQGKASVLRVQQQLLLTELEWTLKPWALLRGRLGYTLQSSDPKLMLAGDAAAGLGGALHLDDFRLTGGVRKVLAAAGQPFVPVDGQLALNVSHLQLSQGWPTVGDGRLQLLGLAWTLARDPVALGDFAVTFSHERDELVALVSTLSGPLDVNGDGRLKADRSYEIHLQVRPKPDAPPMLMNLMRSLGPADAQGYFHIRQQGQLADAAANT